MNHSAEITMLLVERLSESGGDYTLQEVLDGVRDLVASLLVSERVQPDSFFSAVRLRVQEFRQTPAEPWTYSVGEA